MSDWGRFAWPWLLLTLLSVPLLAWFYVRMVRRRQARAVDLGPFGLLQSAGGNAVGRRRHVPPILYLTGLALLCLAAARPEMTVRLPRIEGTVVLAFDTSNSMTADDLEPTRMDAAKEAAQLFVENQPSTVRVGVVAFSNGGLIVQQPTNDTAELGNAIRRLAPEGGTSLGQGIFTALNAIAGERLVLDEEAVDPDTGTILVDKLGLGTLPSSVILLLTDGENTGSPDPLNIAQVAAETGVRIYTIGVGSQEGAQLEIDGFSLVTRLDEALLQEIASVTNGAYYRADDTATLRDIYQNVDLQLTVRAELMEVTAFFAGLGLLCLLVGGALSMLWFGRIP
jgi:Ca-activated chloride channel family protein